jgi:predicted AAA+ superfamily ATPase
MLKDVIIGQQAGLESAFREKYVEREVGALPLEHNLIKVVMGPRRAGKSFYVLHTLMHAGKFGYANFDDEALVEVKDYDEILSEINQVYGNPKILFFDEIQNLQKWELFVNRLQRQGYNIIITGSNSKLLSRELATHLTGRYLPTVILTFSFKEYLAAKGIDSDKLTKQKREETLLEYMRNGGYPETIMKKLNTKEYLDVLFDSILYKDVVKRYNIRKGKEIEKLALYLISNTGGEFSYLSLANATGIGSSITSQKYAGFLEEAYLLFSINRFSYKTKLAGQKKKAYCYDTGLLTAKAFQASPNFGRLFENTVAIHLKKGEIQKKFELYYWKDQQGHEVDFVRKEGARVAELIQACYSLEEKKTREREVRALLKAGKELHCKKLTMLTMKEDKKESEDWFGITGTVVYKPLWKWLLEE